MMPGSLFASSRKSSTKSIGGVDPSMKNMSVRSMPCFVNLWRQETYLCVVLGLVESDDVGDTKPFERLDVVLRSCFEVVALFPYSPTRTHESDEFAGDDPVHVSVLNHFVVLVLQMVEVREVVPPQRNGDFESLHYLEGLQLEGAGSHGGVSEVRQRIFDRKEFLPCDFSRSLEDSDLESADEDGSVH